MNPSLPLQGLRILSAEQYGAGPFGSMLLADLGAEVIKIEPPRDGGDVSRQTGPFPIGDDPAAPDSLFFQSFNRNKKSLTLDLKSTAGQAVLHRLAARCDAVMNNLRGDQPHKLGLTYAALGPVKPALVCVHLSAYGRDNERAGWPGYDYLMQAEAGYLHLTGEPDGPPTRMGLSMVDYMTGITTAAALLAGVLGATRSGSGCDLDISLFDVALAQLTYPASWYLNAGHVVQRMPRSGHPSAVPCELLRTADGWIFVMCMTPKFWEALAHGVGQPQWLQDARFATAATRREHREALATLLNDAFSRHGTRHWMEHLAGKLPLAPVLDLPQALENPFVHHVGMVQPVPHPQAPDQRLLASPVRVDGKRLPARACSALGADTDALLAEAGYDAQEIEQLHQQGVL
ncbi:MAG: CoA transferase [Rhodoferax sp.]|nr:CoA transferase [Rhodoferax sp.]MCB2008423.1 CoA transferase [Rhodoferax sp.]MCB2029612.1 CoA transferase [Rhodoferax sp.]MCB2039471.1 CoA transferase [Rhodoferax sp.]MCP5263587.1 CoA transferase [Rhodoferax sp.]